MKKKRDFVKLSEGQYFEKYSIDTVSEIISKLTPIEKVTTLEVLLRELNEIINDLETQLYDAHVESLEITIGKLVENKGNIDGMSLIDNTTPAGKLWSKIIYLAPNLQKYKDDMESELLFWKNHNYQLNTNKIQNIENEKGDLAVELIWWKGTEGQLIYLYEELVKKNLIDGSQDDRKYVLLSKHFKNKKGEQFTNKQMSQSAQNLAANKNLKPKNSDIIDNITDQTSKQE